MTVPNPYFINIELAWKDGSKVTQNQIARVNAYDHNASNGVVTWEGQSGYDPNTTGWQPIFMQNIAGFYPPREQPSLHFEVVATNEQVVHTTGVYQNIASGSTVHIVIDGQDWLVPGGGGGTDPTWQVFGTVTYTDGTPVTQGLVAVYDVTGTSTVQVGGSATLGSGGTYTVTFLTSSFKDNGQPHLQPNVQVCVYSIQGQELACSAVWNNLGNQTQQVDIPNVPKSTQGNKRRVHGTVRNTLGLPVAGITVEADHLGWTTAGLTEAVLGTTLTGTTGSTLGAGGYEILYDLPTSNDTPGPCGTPTGQINLIVYAKVADPNNSSNTITLASTDVIFNASDDEQVDLIVKWQGTATDSEYELLDSGLSTCFGTAKATTLAELHDHPEYLSFVAQSSQQDLGHLQCYVEAWDIATDINAKLKSVGSTTVIDPQIIYALIRMGLGDSLSQLLNVQPERFFNALIDAIHGGIVAASLEQNMAALLAAWQTVLTVYMTTPDSSQPQWQEQLLSLVFGADTITMQKVVAAHFTFVGGFDDFCAYLTSTNVITADNANNLKFVFELYDAVHQYLGIVRHVYYYKGEFKWQTIKDLASVPLQTVTTPTYIRGWYDYVVEAFNDSSVPIPGDIPGKYEPGNGLFEKATIYAQRLFDLFSNVGPQNQFVSDLGQLPSSSGYASVAEFLSSNPNFDLATGNIDTYLSTNGLTFSSADVSAIKSLQRVYRLTTDLDAATYLISVGLDTAVKIAQIQEDQFVVDYEQFVGGLTAARKIHRTAVHYAGETLFTLVKYHQNLNDAGGITGLPAAAAMSKLVVASAAATGTTTTDTSSDVIRFPNWVTLFGDLSKCTCMECQTVFSPGAYMVDLLQFIKAQFNHGLFDRRPDLQELEITCPNTNNMLPYIDLVNEILEAAVAPLQFPLPNSLDWTAIDNAATGDHVVSDALRSAFNNNSYVLTDQAYIQRSATYTSSVYEWVIEDKAWRFSIRLKQPSDAVYTAFLSPQTSDADSLAVFPEHYNVDAYKALENAVFPLNLPLALGKEQADIFLKQRRVRLHEVLEAFTTVSIADKLDQGLGTLAYLNLVGAEAQTILATVPGLFTYQYWGFDSDTPQISRPDQPTEQVQGFWVTLMAMVPIFMHRTGLTYQQVLDLLDASFVHVEAEDAATGLVITAPSDQLADCNYSQFTIENLNEASLRRISFFVRLWRKLGWTMGELNVYLMDLEQGLIPTDSLHKLFLVKRLCDELTVKPLQVFGWWRTLDTRRTGRFPTSAFDNVFLQGEPSQPEYQAVALVAQGGPAISLDPTQIPQGVDYVAYLRNALNLGATDVELLWSNIVSSELGLTEFTRMYRVVSFCSALKISITDFYDLITLTDNTNPFTIDSENGSVLDVSAVEQTYAAIQEFRRALAIKLPADEIGYFLRNQSTAGDSFVPAQADFDAAVVRIATAITEIVAANPSSASPDADVLTKGLAKIIPADKVGRLVSIVETVSDATSTDAALLVRYFAPFIPTSFITQLLGIPTDDKSSRYALVWSQLSPYLLEQARTAAVTTVASELVSVDKDTVDALLKLSLTQLGNSATPAFEDWKTFLKGGWLPGEVTADNVPSGIISTSLAIPKDGNYQFVVTTSVTNGTVAVTFDGDLLNLQSSNIVKSTGGAFISDSVPLKAGTVHTVQLTVSGGITASLLWQTETTDPVAIPLSATIPFNQDVYLKLYKAARLVAGLGLTKSELQYLNDNQANIAFSFDALPETTGTHQRPVAWKTLADFVDLLSLNRTIALKNETLFEFWTGGDISQDSVATATGWKTEDITTVLALWTTAPAWTDPSLWYVLRACMSIVNRLDLRAQLIMDLLVKAEPTILAANTLKNAYRSQFSKNTWSDTFKPLSDRLRQRQRDALVGYLTVGSDTFNYFDADDLYSHFLIDVQMEPDTQISRLKLALNSIQLYVERILLGLELEVVAYDIDDAKEQWAWMRMYRVWEANRKVFLYPENWIEPELRDDKTPFFVEMEQDLMQHEPSDERGKIVLGAFLDKIAETSNLEVVGAYSQDVGASGINYILHVVGRTRSQSRTFYYRTFLSPQLANGYWTPWRKIDLDIQADVAMPAIFNGRLYLVWPSVLTKQKSQPLTGTADETFVDGHKASQVRATYESEITLRWSQYVPAQNKWLKTCVSKSKAKDTHALTPFERELGQDEPLIAPYHLRIDGVSDDALSLVLVKSKTDSSSDLSPAKLGVFQLLASGHDTFNADTTPLELGYNMPESTILKSNAAEEDGYDANTALKFEQTAAIFNRNSEMFRVYDTNLGYFGPAENKPFFYETPTKSLFGQIKELRVQGGLSPDQQTLLVQFQACNHPVLNQVVNLYQNYGPPGIMNRLTQALPKSDNYYYDYYAAHSSYYYNYYGSLYLGYYIAGDQMAWGNTQRKFEIEYNPGSASVVAPYALPTVEFGYGTPYGVYNWELFFHAPVLIADRLSQDMQFEDAMHWYHFVFDPKLDLNSYEKTRRWAFDLADGSRYWNFLPFFANKDATESLAVTLGFKKGFTVWEKEELNNLIDAWRRDPFNPHLIARQRMVAYQKNVVMKYLDNLIAWGDQLFRQDTFEAINEATQLYILAAQLVGKRPENIEPLIREPRYTYRELDAQGIDHFAEAIADVEYMMVSNKPYVAGLNPDAPTAGAEHFQRLSLQTFFFVIPRNPKLDTYWDTVADRLFKIRNSMNIDGVKRQLALFEPPIEPGLLVRAAAAGLDLSSVLSQLNAPLPLYRFNVWSQRAVDLCNELKSFGAALLAALEKKDAEHLQLLRQDHEVRMLQLVRQVKQLQLDEANAQVEALNRSRKLAEERHDYYSSREKISGQEQTQLTLTEVTTVLDVAQGVAHALTGISGPIPDMEAGMVGPFPAFLTEIKVGSALGTIATAAAGLLGATASATRGLASIAGMNAGYDRRWDDWKLQERLALDEMAQIDQQIVAAEIRVQIAQQELDNQDTQIDQAQEIQTFLEDKFTSEDLYKWMITQLSSTFRQIYNLAYDAAKTAERAFQFELGIADTNYVQSNYMDNLKQGLLTGEKLIFDLKRMDLAYLEKNKREFEIQKPISLATINGSALQDLREKGSCDFDLPEILFDLDYPGQYFRRIRGVRLTIPCVTGPHTNVSAKLSLTSSAIRIDPTVGTGGYSYSGYDDTRFAHDVTGIQSIATGSAQNDPGLFELNFKDERYLPFEGAGVISHWHLELPTAARQFDYDTISDVVIHLSYTSRDAGGLLATQAASDIQTKLNNILSTVAAKTPQGLVRAFSLSKEFPDVFHQLLSQGSASMTLLPEHFPYILRSARLKMALIKGNLVDVRVLLSSHATATLTADVGLVVGSSPPTLPTPTGTMTFDDNGIALTSIDMKKSDLLWNGTQWTQATWSLAQAGLLEDAIEDIVLEVSYLVSPIT